MILWPGFHQPLWQTNKNIPSQNKTIPYGPIHFFTLLFDCGVCAKQRQVPTGLGVDLAPVPE